MANIIKYRPLRSMLDSFFDDWDEWFSWPSLAMPEVRTPLMDIKEDEKSYTVTMELPGMTKDDVHFEVSKNRIEIKGEHKTETEEKNEKEGYLRKERSERSFYRSFALPSEIDADHIEAKLENGILNVHMPKIEPKEEPKTKVEVK